MKGLILVTNPKHVTPTLVLEQQLPRYNSCSGAAWVAKDGEFVCEHYEGPAEVADIVAFMEEHKERTTLMHFGQTNNNTMLTDDKQPFVLFDDGKKPQPKPLLVAAVAGDFSNFAQSGSSHTDAFFVATDHLRGLIKPTLDRLGGDIGKLMDELSNPLVAEALKNLPATTGGIVLMGSNGKLWAYSKDKSCAHPWGWMFSALAPGVQATAAEPRKFGQRAAQAVSAVVQAVMPAPAAPAQPAAPSVPDDPMEVPDETDPNKYRPMQPPDDKPQPQPSAGDEMEVIEDGPVVPPTKPSVPVVPPTTATALPGSEEVIIAPPESYNMQETKRFYRIYLGKDVDLQKLGPRKDSWKDKLPIKVMRKSVRPEHINLLNGLSSQSVLKPKAEEKPKPEVKKDFKELDPSKIKTVEPKGPDPSVRVVEERVKENFLQLLASPPVVKNIAANGELMKKPEEWAKAEEKYKSFTEMMALDMEADVYLWDDKTIETLCTGFPQLAANLIFELRREVMKANIGKHKKKVEPAATTTEIDPMEVPQSVAL